MNRHSNFSCRSFQDAASDLRRHLLAVCRQYDIQVRVTLYQCTITELHALSHELVDLIRYQQQELNLLEQAHGYLDELDVTATSALSQPLDWFPDPTEGYDSFGFDCDDFDVLASDLNGYQALNLRERRDQPTVAPVYNAAVARLSSANTVSNFAARPHLLYRAPMLPINVADLIYAFDHGFLDKDSAMLLLPHVYRARHKLTERWCEMPTSINAYRLTPAPRITDARQDFKLAGLTVVVDFGPYGSLDRYLNHCVLPRLEYYYARDDPDQFPYSYCFLHLVHVHDRLGLISAKGQPQRNLHLFNATVATRMASLRPSASLVRLYILEDGSLHVSNSSLALSSQPFVPIWPPMFNRLLLSWYEESGPQPTKRHGMRLFRLAQEMAVLADLWAYDARLAAQSTSGHCTSHKAPTSDAPAYPPIRFMPTHKPVLFLTDGSSQDE